MPLGFERVHEGTGFAGKFHKGICLQRYPEIYHLSDGELDTVLNYSSTDGVACEPCGVVNVEFLHQTLAMLFDGLGADAQFCCGLFVGLSFGDQLEHFHLA